MKELLIRSQGGKPAAALTDGGKLVAYFPLSPQPFISPEALFLGKAGRVLKNLEAMFVSLPGGTAGFLPFGEMPGGQRPGGGDSLIVQVKKPPQGKKAAFLTMDIALPGRLAVLLPESKVAHASTRLEGVEKSALTRTAARLKPEGMGLVLRAAALNAEEKDILADIKVLQNTWQDIRQKAQTGPAPALLLPAPDPLARLLREEREAPSRILSDDLRAAQSLGIHVESSPDPFALYNIPHQLRQALKRRVYLPSGGTLVIDPCEAGTVIDVNTGRNSVRGQDIILKTNLEAAREAARIIRLRGVGGIVLIDFIDMKTEGHRERVLAAFEEAVKDDPVKTVAHGFTQLGILEATRKKAMPALQAQTLTPCSVCGGSGYKGFSEEETDVNHA
ncbi:MAG: ribonuclease E/G [Eubacteriales bacterium]|nr:ribonuclease E/G [Eubacteriales bacterium]MDD4134151.1 ribonuclease E/G [Eubacteriales bacterium]